MNLKKICAPLLVASLFWLPQAEAKKFKNSYIDFEMPDQWGCFLQQQAWICRHEVSKSCKANSKTPECREQLKKSKEAIIIMAAKEKSGIDSLEAYNKHLGDPRKITTETGNASKSKVIHNKKVNIKKLPWIDGMHLSSELPNYYTRYLATIKGNVAVLVTFSAHKKFYTKYNSEFFKSIKTLNVRTGNIDKVNKTERGNKVLSRPLDIPNDLLADLTAEPTQQNGDGASNLMMILAFILAAFGVIIWFKSRKSN